MSITIHAKNRKVIAKQILQAVQKFPNSFMQSFIIYGSTAQGTASEESDLDIQILVDFATSEFSLYLAKVKNAFEEKYGLEIAINIKSLSQFMEDLWRKEPLYFFMLTDGECLMNSVVFRGLKHILKKERGPTAKALQKAHSIGIQLRSDAILRTTAPAFIRELQEIITSFTSLKTLQNNSVEKWLEFDTSHVYEIIHELSLNRETSHNITQLSNKHQYINESSEFDIIEALKIMNTIFQETASEHE